MFRRKKQVNARLNVLKDMVADLISENHKITPCHSCKALVEKSEETATPNPHRVVDPGGLFDGDPVGNEFVYYCLRCKPTQEKCEECEGKGITNNLLLSNPPQEENCPVCQGTGTKPEEHGN